MSARPETTEFEPIVVDEAHAAALGYRACGQLMPELWKTDALERSDVAYWGLIGAMTLEGTIFANRLKDKLAEVGYNNLEAHMGRAVVIPNSVPKFLDPPFQTHYFFDIAWRLVASYGKPWMHGTEKPLAHPQLGSYYGSRIVLTRQGELALVASLENNVSKKYRRRITGPNGEKKQTGINPRSPYILLPLQKTGPVLAQYFVAQEKADTPAKRETVLNAWRELLGTRYKDMMTSIEDKIRCTPLQH